MLNRSVLILALVVLAVSPPLLADSQDELEIPAEIQRVLKSSCAECHGKETGAGEVSFVGLGSLSLKKRLDIFNRAQDQLFFGLMPPDDAQQLSKGDREALAKWLRSELRKHRASKLDAKLRYPDFGNYVSHEKLFDAKSKTRGFTPARRWLVSPQIFHERVIDVFKLTGRDRENKLHGKFYGVTNPFLLPDHSGVRYYDIGALDGGHLLVMLGNARWIADRQILIARSLGSDRRKIKFANPKDRWLPRSPPESYRVFQEILLASEPPGDESLLDAIREQFDCALRREPTRQEADSYLKLLRQAIQLGGNSRGLREMMVAVLLESEFVYRLEFGRGKGDTDGRRKLSPREASYAISYALGDRRPDAKLIAAASEGRLVTRADFKREAARLLADEHYYRGQVDPTLNGKHYRSNVTSHPKIVRFFRDFFGYAGSLKVFKDGKRSDGLYRNPGRGSQATPGWLTLEADRIVTWHVEKDQSLFETLLTSDDFFVYHDKDNETGQQIIKEWSSVYERLKNTDWKTNPQMVLNDHLEFLKTKKSMRIRDASRPGELVNYMHFFSESFGQGRTPFTTIPWAHGYTFHHAPFYSLPRTPSIGRYGSWKSTKYQAKVKKRIFWDYPTTQPFKIPKRKGILTHPAWLIAHSTNFHSDPIRRGRWIREKLLAGRVPDVPITVDAQVPEDPHRTFRQRVERVTGQKSCWKCHQQMNPLGLAFEMFDDFGRYRTQEKLEHPDNLLKSGNGKTTFDVYKMAPVVTTGELSGTGDASLDGKVNDALDMIDRLARADRVRQSIIRFAFRFYLGRNEMLSDAQTLIDADRAYVDSGGSFKAVIVSLLSSDSFMYRKQIKD